jgi:RHS repeat-associated protein
VVDPSGNVTLNSVTNYTYDNVGQLINITLPNSVELNYTYDGSRRLTGISNNLGESIAYSLDNAGNRTAETILNSGGGISYSVTRAFDELSRVMDVIGAEYQTTHVDYDVNDNATTVTDPRSNATNQSYDPLDRLQQIADAAGGTTQFSYDDQDRLTSVTDANGNTTIYNYDAFDNVTQVNSPDTGIATYRYDNANNRISMTDSRGVVVNYTYDALNRLTSVTYSSAPEENISYQYDQTANGNQGIGRLTNITDQSGSTAYQYDHRGNLAAKTTTLNSQAYTTAYQYDLGNNPTAITYPSGLIVRYAYDSLGRTQIVTTEQPGELPQTIASNATYLPFGSTTSLTYGNGLHKTLAYDQDYRLTDLTTGTVVDMSYRYDPNGNIIQIDHLNQPANDQLFGYDTLDRLSNSSGDYGILDFDYDPLGNRLSRDQTQGSDTQNESYYYFLDSNQLNDIDRNTNIDSVSTNSQRSFSYDNNGNPIAIVNTDADATDFNSTYNDANRLSQVTIATAVIDYTYNALGQRVQKNSGADTPDYLALADEQTAIANNYRQQIAAEQATINNLLQQVADDQAQVDNLLASAYELELQAQSLEVLAQQQQAAINRSQQRYQNIQRRADQWRERIIESPRRWYQRYLNYIFTRIANYYQGRADQALAVTTKLQAEQDQWLATAVDYRAQANALIEQADEAAQSINSLQQQITTLEEQISEGLTLADAADQLAAEYRQQVSENPPRVLTSYVYGKSGQLMGEYSEAGQARVEYVWLNGQPLAQVRGNLIYYYHNDHLGTPRALTDQSQSIVWKASYTPFGEAAITTEIVENNIRFPGQYFDGETGLHYNYFRYYDPKTGRFTQSDPTGLFDGMNTYLYARANPFKYVDLNGLWSVTLEGYLGAGGGARVAYSNGTLEITGRLGVGFGLGLEVDPNATVSPHSEKCGSDYIARTTFRANATGGVGVADLGIAYEGASGNAVVSSTLDDVYSSPSPFTVNFGEPSKFGVKLGASVGVDFGSYTNF